MPSRLIQKTLQLDLKLGRNQDATNFESSLNVGASVSIATRWASPFARLHLKIIMNWQTERGSIAGRKQDGGSVIDLKSHGSSLIIASLVKVSRGRTRDGAPACHVRQWRLKVVTPHCQIDSYDSGITKDVPSPGTRAVLKTEDRQHRTQMLHAGVDKEFY